MKGFFVTGTDTGVGKTTVSAALLSAFKKQGLSTLGIKPVATGCTRQGETLWCEDAAILYEASTIKLPQNQFPFYFEPPTAPSIAAAISGNPLTVKIMVEKIKSIVAIQGGGDLSMVSPEVLLVEGLGGWQAPLNTQETMADLAQQLGFPVILVVGLRLGCINHALLTFEAIRAKKLACAGWVANPIDPTMPYQQETVDTIQSYLPIPNLGILPYLTEPMPLDWIRIETLV